MDRVRVDGLYGLVWPRALGSIGWHDAFGVMARPRSFIMRKDTGKTQAWLVRHSSECVCCTESGLSRPYSVLYCVSVECARVRPRRRS